MREIPKRDSRGRFLPPADPCPACECATVSALLIIFLIISFAFYIPQLRQTFEQLKQSTAEMWHDTTRYMVLEFEGKTPIACSLAYMIDDHLVCSSEK